jgi:hypothetical protein
VAAVKVGRAPTDESRVHSLFRPLVGAAAALALGAVALTPAAASADPAAAVKTTAATGVTDTSATLTGVVGPERNFTVYTFQYGVTSYDHQTPVTRLPPADSGRRAVSTRVTGLAPATLYHVRLVAGDAGSFGWIPGDDRTFTTAPPPAPLPPAVVPPPVAPPAAAAPVPAPAPALGRHVVVAPLAGTVKVRPPGATRFAVLGAGDAVPSGATVDSRAGTVALTTALPGGRTQVAQFHGGVFRVRQSAAGDGTTDIDLRGPALDCGPVRARAAAVTRRKPPQRKLWAADNGGRFRTHGRNSVTTVRGTKWVTTDTCAGTRTTVTAGAVLVRDLRRKRTVLVRGGHSYVARRR